MHHTNQQLQEKLIGAVIGLVKATGNNPKTENTDYIVLQAMESSAMDEKEVLEKALLMVQEEKDSIVPNCKYCQNPCGNTSDFDFQDFDKFEAESAAMKRELIRLLQSCAQKFATKEDKMPYYRGIYAIGYETTKMELEEIIKEIVSAVK